MFLFGDLSSDALFTLGVALITLVLLYRIYKKTRKRSNSKVDWAGSDSTRRETKAAEREAVWEAELEEKLRGIEARLNNKIAALEYLLSEAEAAIRRLEELSNRDE